MQKEVGIAIKSKQTSNQLKPEIYLVLATVIIQSQMHAQIKHSLVHLQNLIPSLAGVFTYSYILYQPK